MWFDEPMQTLNLKMLILRCLYIRYYYKPYTNDKTRMCENKELCLNDVCVKSNSLNGKMGPNDRLMLYYD